MIPVITIDGPSGSGKGTISQLLATHLGWHYLDSGALYRILAHAALKNGVDLGAEDELASLAGSLDIRFQNGAKLNGLDVEQAIRSESMGNCASKVAQWPTVRAALLALQKRFAQSPGLVADGRDMGTTVFPDSPLKIYLIASVEERAKRRCEQMQKMGLSAPDEGDSIAALCREIAERDERDANRASSPLKPADDAHIIDTSEMSIDAVLAKILKLISSTKI